MESQARGNVITGGGVFPDGGSFWETVYNLTLFHSFMINAPRGPRSFLPTLNLSVRRRVFSEVGLFSSQLARGEDVDWSIRALRTGYQPYFEPAAAVRHLNGRRTLPEVWQDCAASGYFMRHVRLQNPDLLRAPRTLRYRWLIPLLSPLIASWATWRIVRKQPLFYAGHPRTLAAIFLTKLAWCAGASSKGSPLH